jgi:hypothetical protein
MANSRGEKFVRTLTITAAIFACLLIPVSWCAASPTSSSPRVWAFERGVATFYPTANSLGGQILFSSPYGEQVFNYNLSGFRVKEIASNSKGIYILLNETVTSSKGVYRVDYCDYSGRCLIVSHLNSNVFKITSHEDGFYALLYDGKLFKSDAGDSPLNGSVWRFDRSGMHKICCARDVSIYGIYYNKYNGLTLSGNIEIGAARERVFGLYYLKSDGTLEPAPGFPPFGARSVPDVYPGSCDEYIYVPGKFFCIFEGGAIDNENYIITIAELSNEWRLTRSFKAASFPSLSSDGRMIYMDMRSAYKSIELLN